MTRLRSLIKEVLSQPKKKDCNCGCNTCGDKAPILTEGKFKSLISEGLQHHIDKKISLFESVYRIGSEKHLELIREARALWIRGIIEVSDDDKGLLETHLGHFGLYEGVEVPLDLPMVNEEAKMPSQEEVNKFFSITQNEMHYLNSKPVMGQKRDRVRSEIEPWDEYDLSNWNALVRKAKAQGKLNEEVDEDGFSDKIIKSVIKPEEVSRLSKVLNSNNIPFKTEKLGKVTMFKFKNYDDVDKVEALISRNRIDIDESLDEASLGYAEVRKLEKSLSSKNKEALAKAIKNGTIKTSKDLSNWAKSIKESVDEGFYSSPSDLEDSGLNVIPKDQIHANKLQDALEDSGLYGEWNPREGYFFFPEEEDGYDYLEEKIQELMDDYNIQGYIEGVFEESLNEVKDKWVVYDTKTKKRLPNAGKVYKDRKAAQAFADKQENAEVASDTFYFDKIQESLEERINTILEAKKKKKKEKKDPPLNKPKRGGSKAYYVYVRDPKTKKIKKVSFGSGGLRAKIKNKEARNAFAARHNCKNKKDRTKAGYWSCNLPRYAEQLGLGSKMNTFW